MMILDAGRPTNHKKFGEATAILAGDGLLNLAYLNISKDILETKDIDLKERKLKSLYELTYGTDRMIAGEYVDTEFEGKEVSNEYLEYMHKNKTGALIRACCRIGAIIAGASKEDLEKITNYAENIGLAFQIKDDILSEIGDEKILGKPVGNDRINKKVTFVTKYGLEKSMEILDETINKSIKEIESYGEKAEFLKELALYIKNREKWLQYN